MDRPGRQCVRRSERDHGRRGESLRSPRRFWATRVALVSPRVFTILLTKLFTIAQNFHANSPLPSAQVLNANLADPDVPCGSVEVGGIWRSSCKWPFRCCSTWRPPHTLTEHGSPLSRATTRSTLSTPDSRSTLSSTTVVDTPPRSLQDDQEVREVAPPTPGAHVIKDPEHPHMSTPVRANQVTTTTPADSAKKAGDNDGHPINLN